MKPLIMILTLAMLMNVGCAQEKKTEAEALAPVVDVDCTRGCDPGGGIPGAPGGSGGGSDGQGGYYSGATASLTKVTNLGQMFFNSYPNSPQQIQVNVDMNRTKDSVIISYVDGGKVVEAAMGAQSPYSGKVNTRYNGWITEGSSRVYKGFFQDEYGAIVVIIDKVLNVGDGTASPFVGGSIWFQNFGDNPTYDNPYYRYWSQVSITCWEITYGPYDCRSFLVSGGTGGTVSMTSSAEPTTRGETRTKSYQKLGEFNGLSRALANLPAQ